MLGGADRLHQVLLSLLSDAIKFTAQGRVRFEAGVLHDTPGALTVRFWVENTDIISIAPEQQARILEAFA